MDNKNMYKPLTPEQFNNAKKAGYTPDKIIAMEKIRKEKDGGVEQPKKESFVGGMLKGLVRGATNPLVRVGQLASLGIARLGGKDAYEEQAKKVFDDPTKIAGIDYKAVKPVGQGGIKQALGEGLEFASNIPIVGTAGLVANAGKEAFKQGGKAILKRAVPAVLEGAAAGALQGGGSALQENKNFGQTLGATALGAGIGGATGGVLDVGASAVGSGIRGITKGAKYIKEAATPNVDKQVMDIVSPRLTIREKKALIKRGQGYKEGVLGDIELSPDTTLNEVANSVKGVVNPKSTLVENINKVKTVLGDEADKLKNELKSYNIQYNPQELQQSLMAVEKPISIRSDATLDRQFDLAREAAMEIANKSGTTIDTLLDARKAFDDLVDKEFPNIYDRENASMREAILRIRREMNNFIESKLPEGSNFRDSLRLQSNYFDAIDNMNTKAFEEIGSNVLSRLIKKYPKTAKVGKVLIPAGVGGALVKTAFD